MRNEHAASQAPITIKSRTDPYKLFAPLRFLLDEIFIWQMSPAHVSQPRWSSDVASSRMLAPKGFYWHRFPSVPTHHGRDDQKLPCVGL